MKPDMDINILKNINNKLFIKWKSKEMKLWK